MARNTYRGGIRFGGWLALLLLRNVAPLTYLYCLEMTETFRGIILKCEREAGVMVVFSERIVFAIIPRNHVLAGGVIFDYLHWGGAELSSDGE